MTTQILTVTLRNGQVALAKNYQGIATVKTFANRTQAEKAAASVGGWVRAGYPFLVILPQAPEGAAANLSVGQE